MLTSALLIRHRRCAATWQAFWMKPGRTADRLRDALAERAAAGVRVLFLHDHFGSRGIDESWYDTLRSAGAEVATFRTPGLMSLYKRQHRNHTRSVVIDGRIGYTGGFGIDDRWQGGGRAEGECATRTRASRDRWSISWRWRSSEPGSRRPASC